MIVYHYSRTLSSRTPRGRFIYAVAGYHIQGGWDATPEAIRRSLGTAFTGNVERNTGVALDALSARQFARLEKDILELVKFLRDAPKLVK